MILLLGRNKGAAAPLFCRPFLGGSMRIPHFAVIAALSLATAVFAQEKKIQRADLPPAVEKTVAAQTQGATIKVFSEEKANGRILYEAETIRGGHTRDITIDANGSLVEVEEQVPFD